jgi:hypothetical protein
MKTRQHIWVCALLRKKPVNKYCSLRQCIQTIQTHKVRTNHFPSLRAREVFCLGVGLSVTSITPWRFELGSVDVDAPSGVVAIDGAAKNLAPPAFEEPVLSAS